MTRARIRCRVRLLPSLESRIVTAMDENASAKAVARDLRPSSAAGFVRVVRPLPRKLGARVLAVVPTVHPASDRPELKLASLVASEGEMSGNVRIDEVSVPRLHLHDSPAPDEAPIRWTRVGPNLCRAHAPLISDVLQEESRSRHVQSRHPQRLHRQGGDPVAQRHVLRSGVEDQLVFGERSLNDAEADRVGPSAALAPPHGLGHHSQRVAPLRKLVGVERILHLVGAGARDERAPACRGASNITVTVANVGGLPIVRLFAPRVGYRGTQ